jgi:hypothetical protein
MTSVFPIPTFVAIMIAIIVTVKFKRIISSFLDSGTTSPRSAKTVGELNIRRGMMFTRLLKRDVVIEPEPGRFYINEENLASYNQLRRKRVFIVLGIFFVLIVLDIFFKMNS